MRKLILLIPVLFALSCQQKASDKNVALAIVKDVHSFAKPEKAIVKHLELDLNVDFATQIISGKASWTIENISGGTEIVFDSRQLQIQKITLGTDETETTFTLF